MKLQKLGFLAIAVALTLVIPAQLFGQAGARGRAAAPSTYTLTINSNVRTAAVFINGNEQKDSLPMTLTLSPGTYQVQVRAAGYLDFSQSVNLNSNQTVNANLQPATAQVSLNLPAAILDRTVSNAAAQVQVFVDNRQVSGTSFEVNAGRRTIRVRSGGVSTEVTMDFAAGRRYTVTPSFGFEVREGTAAAAPPPAPAPAQQPPPPPPAPAAPATPAPAATQGPGPGTPPALLVGNMLGFTNPARDQSVAIRLESDGQVVTPGFAQNPTGAVRWRMPDDRQLVLMDSSGATVVSLRLLWHRANGWDQRWQEDRPANAAPGWTPAFIHVMQ